MPRPTTSGGGERLDDQLPVRDLDAMLAQLRAAGATVDERIETLAGFGRFGWFEDPDEPGELWEPPTGM